MARYFIETDTGRDGPHDLITIMRRIRAGRITFTTPIYCDASPDPIPAGSIPEIFPFFAKDEDGHTAPSAPRTPELRALIAGGWRFTLEHNVMTVYAGGVLLTGLLLGFGLVGTLGPFAGGLIAWCLFFILHHVYLICVLRLYRGQPLGQDFIDRHLAPALMTLIPTCIALALLLATGFALLIVPGVIAATAFAFVPFLILDKRCGIKDAMKHSVKLLRKQERSSTQALAALSLLHALCLVAIIPIPLTLPLFAAALSELYEALSNS